MTSLDAMADKPGDRASRYRSEAERSIAEMLNAYGIPFYYKQPTLVVDNGHRCIEYVDFFLPTYAGVRFSHFMRPRRGQKKPSGINAELWAKTSS